MRTLTKFMMVAVLAVSVSSTANAALSIGLVQVGGTYNGVTVVGGDTLVLDVTWNGATTTDTVSLIDPAVAYTAGSILSFDGGTETGGAANGSFIALAPFGVIGADITDAGGFIDGLEKGLAGPWTGPCVAGACGSMGTLSFTLSATGGVFDLGGVLAPTLFGTIINDGSGGNITGTVSLGTFTVNPAVPEPTTVAMLGLGLVGLGFAGRQRKS